MNYHDHKDSSKSFRALTGVNHEQFCALLPYFEAAHEDYLSEYEMTGERRSGKRNSPLPSISDRLFFILVYLKNNPLQEYHAACFGMNQKHCNIFIHCLTKILRLSLKAKGLVPAETDKELAERLAELSKEGDKPVLLHDGTEREIPRPADRDMQKERYSGKKKRHCNDGLSGHICQSDRFRQDPRQEDGRHNVFFSCALHLVSRYGIPRL